MDYPPKLEDDLDLEEGEYGPFDEYDPSLEFPGEDSQPQVSEHASYPRFSSPPPTAPSSLNRTTTLRLIAIKSTVLSSSKRVAVLDGHAEVSIGRDVALTARIRLKEMAVSKFHVSIYWDGAKREWGIVDRGSMHGTYVWSTRNASTSIAGSAEQPQGTRLSPPRMASLPKVLRHLDEITIGGTTFRVHEHSNGRPCPECTIDDKGEIPLFASSSSSSKPSTQEPKKRKLDVEENARDPRKAMAKLKSSLMSRHQVPDTKVPTSLYKDRSALRRELHPDPKLPVPPIPPSLVPPPIHRRALSLPDPSPSQPEPSAPPKPISSDSIGHKLLLSQGWNPGTALGENPTIGLTEPLEIQQRSHRAGLGAQSSSKSFSSETSKWAPDWQEEAKRRRWNDAGQR